MMKFFCPGINQDFIKERLETYSNTILPFEDRSSLAKFILNVIDHTSLNGTDNSQSIRTLCREALNIRNHTNDGSTVASVCIYPVFADIASGELQDSQIYTACVAGAFPSGQSPLTIKVSEASQAVKEGADEIDMVISRGKMIEEDYSYIYHEIHEIKKAIGKTHLKVILETGELADLNLICKASEIAIQAGADFIKTSTGKTKPAATPEAFLVMLEVILKYKQNHHKKIGIKPAGGISDPETAINYVKILYGHLGKEWLDKSLFRIGASSLTNKILPFLNH